MSNGSGGSALLARYLVEAAAHADGCVEPVLERAGLEREIMTDVDYPVPYESMARLWRLAEAATGDPVFALHFTEQLKPDRTYPCNYLMATSATVGEGLLRLVRYAQMASGGGPFDLSIGAADARITRRSQDPCVHADEFLAAFIVLRSRQATGVDWAPTEIAFQHRRDVGVGELSRFFRCPIAFGQPELVMRFPSSVLELPHKVAAFDSDLFGLLTQYVEDMRASLPVEPSPIAPVASAVAKQLGHELPTLASTAKLLRVTERTLQRRLADGGVTYSKVFDDVRRALAMRFLADPYVSIAQVGFMLHFADESAFQRAFKRWTGQTPGQYRRSLVASPVTDARGRRQLASA